MSVIKYETEVKAMEPAKEIHNWSKYVNLFSETNSGRPTRLGVFERKGDIVNDYWLESGLPLTGVDIDTHDGRTDVQITLGTFTHEISNAVELEFHLDLMGDEEGLDVRGSDGTTTVLRFERFVT